MDRQTIMETNRSLRTIKTELENLYEKGIISEAAFDTINNALPAETPLRGAGVAATRSNNPTPVQAAATPPPAQSYQNQGFNNSQAAAAPPSYNDTPAPALPGRSNKPVLSHARALYRYAANDSRDLYFEKDDQIAVYEYMNKDWWMGQNRRTGQEGIFPQNYVLVEQDLKGPPPAAAAAAYPHQPSYGYPAASQGPPPQQNPYNSSVPPMAIAEGDQSAQGGQGNGKVGEYGKKFGKKLGNAAVFGAGATIGSNIVNSIF